MLGIDWGKEAVIIRLFFCFHELTLRTEAPIGLGKFGIVEQIAIAVNGNI
ncbi:hypothetical protein HPY31_13755 [Brevibacillus sp. HB1.3]|nr:hypothetical protein [Brevibacillus sp. HB1.3]NQF14977.1 hypothetical protein [Brevibacillus sp. HB1.3]